MLLQTCPKKVPTVCINCFCIADSFKCFNLGQPPVPLASRTDTQAFVKAFGAAPTALSWILLTSQIPRLAQAATLQSKHFILKKCRRNMPQEYAAGISPEADIQKSWSQYPKVLKCQNDQMTISYHSYDIFIQQGDTGGGYMDTASAGHSTIEYIMHLSLAIKPVTKGHNTAAQVLTPPPPLPSQMLQATTAKYCR